MTQDAVTGAVAVVLALLIVLIFVSEVSALVEMTRSTLREPSTRR